MKKIIFIALITIYSCGYKSPNFRGNVVVIEIGQSVSGECYYIVNGSSTGSFSQILSPSESLIYDSCGKYQIGDTLKIIKK